MASDRDTPRDQANYIAVMIARERADAYQQGYDAGLRAEPDAGALRTALAQLVTAVMVEAMWFESKRERDDFDAALERAITLMRAD